MSLCTINFPVKPEVNVFHKSCPSLVCTHTHTHTHSSVYGCQALHWLSSFSEGGVSEGSFALEIYVSRLQWWHDWSEVWRERERHERRGKAVSSSWVGHS